MINRTMKVYAGKKKMKALNTIIQCCYRRYICHQRLISDETLISLTLFFKITETGLLEYLFNVTPQISYKYNTRTLLCYNILLQNRHF